MIKVNLSGKQQQQQKKPVAKVSSKPALSAPSNALPLLHLIIVAGTAAFGYFWYSNLTAQSADLTNRISVLKEEQSKLDAVIKQEKIYESRKAAFEKRIQIIEDLRKNQLSPVVILDALANAIDRTRYVWLSNLSQNNALISMSGTGTSVDTLSDFVANLKSTGYFRDINLAKFEDSRGNYTFSLTCEFSPPSLRAAETAEKGAN
ncbi:MAG TPA: PilN domain-containing protein [Terriglobia bacterium]|nr:PilN domain-containing protein [Terriglobia bacterium]